MLTQALSGDGTSGHMTLTAATNYPQRQRSGKCVTGSAIHAGEATMCNHSIYNNAPSDSSNYIVLINNSQVTGNTNTIYNWNSFGISVGLGRSFWMAAL